MSAVQGNVCNNSLAHFCYNVPEYLKTARGSTEAYTQLLALGQYLGAAAELAAGTIKPLSLTIERSGMGISFADTVGAIQRICTYWIQFDGTKDGVVKDLNNGEYLKFSSNLILDLAEITGVYNFLELEEFCHLGSVASSIGTVPVLGVVVDFGAKIGLSVIVGSAVVVGKTLQAIRHSYKLSEALQNNDGERVKLEILNLTSKISGIAVTILFMVPNPVTTPLAITCGVVSTLSSITGYVVEQKLNSTN